TGLTELGLNANPLTACSGLAALTNLTSLWFDGPPIAGMNCLPLTRLKALSLRGRELADFTALNGRSNLVAVFAERNRLAGLTVFESLPSLLQLNVSGNVLNPADPSVKSVITDLRRRGVRVDYLPQNQPPRLTLAAQWTIPANTTSSLKFDAGDEYTWTEQLTVTAVSSNTNLITAPTVAYCGELPSHLLTLTPRTNQTGTATIT